MIFSPDFVEIAAFLACNVSVKLPILNQCRVRMRRLYITPSGVITLITPCVSPSFCQEVKIVLHLLMLQIFIINIFVLKYFPRFFFSKFFPTIIFSEFFFQIFFFKAFTLDASPHAEIKRLFKYLWYEKYGMQQAVEIGLSSRVMCRVLVFGSYCSHHTRRKKSIFSPCCIIYYFAPLHVEKSSSKTIGEFFIKITVQHYNFGSFSHHTKIVYFDPRGQNEQWANRPCGFMYRTIFFFTNSCEPELAHRLQTSKMRRNSTLLASWQHDDINIVTVNVARRRWTAPLKPRRRVSSILRHFTLY